MMKILNGLNHAKNEMISLFQRNTAPDAVRMKVFLLQQMRIKHVSQLLYRKMILHILKRMFSAWILYER